MILFRCTRGVCVRFIIFFLTSILAGILFFRIDTVTTEYLNYNHYEMVHLNDQMRIEQRIRPSQNFLRSISFFCANIETDMGILELEIADEEGKIIYQNEIEADTLKAGEFNCFAINKIVRADEDYVLGLEFKGRREKDSFLGLMMVPNEMNLAQNGTCSFEGMKSVYSLAVVYEMGRIPPKVAGVMLFAFILMMNVFIIPAIGNMKMTKKLMNKIILRQK